MSHTKRKDALNQQSIPQRENLRLGITESIRPQADVLLQNDLVGGNWPLRLMVLGPLRTLIGQVGGNRLRLKMHIAFDWQTQWTADHLKFTE